MWSSRAFHLDTNLLEDSDDFTVHVCVSSPLA